MKMKLTDKGSLEIDLWTLFENLSLEQINEIAQIMACEDLIIKHVTDQIIEGRTENLSCGAKDNDSPDPYRALSKARREIAKNSSEIAAEEINSLESSLRREKENHKKTGSWAWKMYHEWPIEYIRNRPDILH